ncbi:MAG: protein kinase, partial [Planctomycetes bacterium]|nr:protein kinase [Planctomycetota bacterium]
MAAPDKGSLRTEDGTINGRYRVVRELGRGGMGRVFLVEDASAGGRRVALKAIWGHKASAEFMERFRDEFSILVKVQHENIASAFDFGQVRGTGELFFTTAFIDGQDALAATEHATADQLVDIFKQVLRGLDFLHSHGLLHNDLKPSNVLLEAAPCGAEGDGEADVARLEAKVFGSAGKVKIIDFGLLSREGVAWQKVMGTPRYLSPERIRKQPADRRSDLYSAGAFFYHVCARVPPFEAKDSRSLLRMHLEAEPVPLTRLRRDLPESVARLVGRLLRKRPEDRFDSARSALEVLCEDLGQGGAPEARSRVPEVRAGRLVGRERELGLLEERFRRVLGPEPESACVVLEGPAGVGKTRLVQELRALVQVSGGAFVSLDGASVSGHLGPVLEAIVAALETRGVGTCARLSAGAGAGAAAGGGEEMSSRIEGLVLETAKEVPVLLHVDDFHRASRIVRRFALELVSAALERGDASRRARRLMVVISRRDELRGDELHVSGVESVRLGAFAAETSRDLVREAFGQEDVPSAILETLVRVSAGNPGLLLELARELVAAERVKYSGSAWVFPASLADLPLPGSLGAVMRRRVDALDAVSRDALDWLAVCRAPASIALLARCLRKDEAPVRETLERLARLGLVAAGESPGGLRAYNVLHEVTRSIALEGQEPGRLKALHLGLAQAIEDAAGGSGGSEAWSDVLAYHWLESGNEPGFRRYAPAAVRRLQACGDLKGAIEHQRRMLDALPPDATGKRVESLARLSELHECAWDLEATQKDLEALLEAGGSLLAREDRAAVLRRMALLEIARNQCSAALGAIEEARRCLGSASDPLVRLSLDAPEAWAAWLAGQDERSRG